VDAESTYVRSSFRANSRSPQGVEPNEESRLRSNIIETEDRIIEDIRKIQIILTPKNVANRLISTVAEKLFRRIETMNTQTINEMSDKVITNTVETVKGHPVMAALLGLGVSLYLADRMFMRQRSEGGESIGQMEEGVSQLIEKTGQYADVKLSDSKENARETGEEIVRRSQSLLEGISGFMEENPLTTGLIGLSAGLVVGLLTGGAFKGSGFLEDTRQAVREKTRQILNDTREKAGHVVDAAGKAAREEAERQLIRH
jgi:ElaB/YqjD/DUF883 family membrane-anchored ribosome-binding protein